MATAEIHVTLKPALLDTQGATVRKALHQLGYTGVQDVRIGKFITVELDGAQGGPQVQALLEEMCQKLLANPVIEDFEIALDEADASQPVTQQPAAPLVDGALTTPHATTNAGTPPSPSSSITGAPVGATGAATLPLTPLAQMTSAPYSGAPGASQQSAPTATGLAASTGANPLTENSPTALNSVPVSGLSPAEQLKAHTVSSSEASTPEPFALEFDRFEDMGPADKMALQELAWRKHGAWIRESLDAKRAAWILCVGQRVVASGDSIETFPSDEARAKAGRESGLVPWVFVRPPAL